jgi:hypothetical protein
MSATITTRQLDTSELETRVKRIYEEVTSTAGATSPGGWVHGRVTG